MKEILTWLKSIPVLNPFKRKLKEKAIQRKLLEQYLQTKQEMLLKQQNVKTQGLPKSNNVTHNPELTQLELPLDRKDGSPNLSVLVPSNIPVYRYTHPYGCITVYVPTQEPLSAERVYLMLEQAKHDMFHHLKPQSA